MPQVVRGDASGQARTLAAGLNTRAPKCSCRYSFPLVVLTGDPSSAGAISVIAARDSATTVAWHRAA